MVKSKLDFKDFCLLFNNTNQVLQNPIHTFRQNSIICEKPGHLPEKLKILTSSNNHRALYFLLKFCARFLMPTKGCSGFSLFCFDFELLVKM